MKNSQLYVQNENQVTDGCSAPQLIANSGQGGSLLAAIKSQLANCVSFDFCVAFVADSGLQVLIEAFNELRDRGVKGRLLTSTYLNFNSPAAFNKLLQYDNIETRVFQGNLHAKGYMFDDGHTGTVIVGSSNMTQMALTCNKEWNVLYKSYDAAGLLLSLRAEFDSLWNDDQTVRLTTPWIEKYAAFRSENVSIQRNRSAFFDGEASSDDVERRKAPAPNKMQKSALEALAAIHRKGDPRALLVSATGTGKTYLSAFDVLAARPKRVLFLAHRRRILDASRASYERLLGERYTFDTHAFGKDVSAASCVFAMCSTVAPHIDEFNPNEFDYIVIDEAHRVASATYLKILDYFKPAFVLGMTATPNRTDGYDVYALFNHVIAYQITLQDALAEDMLAPFHYFGIADLAIDDAAVEDLNFFGKLTSDERVRHIVEKIEEYSISRSGRRGLIFCNRNAEARELSRKFNDLGYRTVAISGADSDEVRDQAISALESGKIEYIFSVDIMNEGVDIPSLNQIIMLRRTDSSIVFVQQLGRGLRKDTASGKEYVLVLDFIGNYQSNYLVPVALSGDKTYNKDRLRRLVQEGDSVIPGCSTVSFDKVSESRIYQAIDGGDFTSIRFLRSEYMDLRQRLGRIPSLIDFDETGSIDPLLIFKNGSLGSYHAFLSRYEPGYDVVFSELECNALKFISQKLAAGKRFEDLFLLKEIIERGSESREAMRAVALDRYNADLKPGAVKSAIAVLKGDFSAPKNFVPLVIDDGFGPRLMKGFADALRDAEFKRQVLEVLDFGLRRNRQGFATTYADTSLVLNAKYTYEDVCRLLNWDKNINGQNMGGYKYDEKTNTFPVFINYDKAPDISSSIAYEDRFVSEDTLIAISKQPRHLDSPEIRRLQSWKTNGMKVYLFMRKNKDDGTSKEFYFLGEMEPTGRFKEILMEDAQKPAVEIEYRLKNPVRQDIYAFMTSDLSE